MTTYKAYKSAIEEFDEKFKGWILQDDQEFYRSFDTIKSFLKSQAIKGIDEQVKWLEEDGKKSTHYNSITMSSGICPDDGFCPKCQRKDSWNEAILYQISYLLEQKKLINEDK